MDADDKPVEKAKKEKRKTSKIRSWIESILEAALIVLVMFCICWPMQVHGDSMEHTFHSGDRVVISRVLVFFKQIKQGDIVVCKLAENGDKKDIIKRVIGVPGDEIVIRDGVVRVNGDILQEDYVDGAETLGNMDVKLADDEYFVMGDNRAISYDSRKAGPIHQRDMIGKVLFRFYPFGAMKAF